MPIILPPIARRQFIKGTLVLGASALVTSRASATADSEGAALDQSRVALLADTHISADPNRVYPGTKWPGSPVKEGDHENVHIAKSLEAAVSAK